MQRAKQVSFRDRSLFYATLPLQKQAPRGKWDYRLKAVYLVAVLDFVLFNEFETDREYVIEYVRLMREQTKTPYSKKLNFVFVELPKFKKTEEELVTNADRWLFVLRNLSQLKEPPRSLRGRIFETLFQLAEIKELTKEDMREYRKSILKYRDVRDAVDLARDEGREEGIEKGKVSVIQKCLQNNLPMEVIINITGFSKEQIMQLR
jgi:predicted transposase/invertase (TIGR01784 family)